MAGEHTIIEELPDAPDLAHFDADLNKMLSKLDGKPELLLECVMAFLQRTTTLLTTSAGRDKANTVINTYVKRSSTGTKPLQAGFFGKSAAVASPASRRDTPAEKQVCCSHPTPHRCTSSTPSGPGCDLRHACPGAARPSCQGPRHAKHARGGPQQTQGHQYVLLLTPRIHPPIIIPRYHRANGWQRRSVRPLLLHANAVRGDGARARATRHKGAGL